MSTEDPENKTYTDMIGHLRNEYEVRIWVADLSTTSRRAISSKIKPRGQIKRYTNSAKTVANALIPRGLSGETLRRFVRHDSRASRARGANLEHAFGIS